MRFLFPLFFLFTNTLFSQSELKMSNVEITNFKERVSQKAKSIKTITTDFNQSKHLDFLENTIESKGQMLLNNQGFLKWQYFTPNKYSIIFKNNSVFIDDNGKKSTANVDQKLFNKISALIAGSIKGNIFNDNAFVYDFFKSEKKIIVKMKTVDTSVKKYISNIVLTFDENEALVDQVKLIEPSGDYTLIVFQNRKLNVTIDDKEFNN
jgi:outer membrane lipoprotein carrier protein